MNKKTKGLIIAGVILLLLSSKASDGASVQKPSFCNVRPSTAQKPRTANFKLSEFNSPDIQSVPKWAWGNILLLMEQLEIVRAHFNDLLGGGVSCAIRSGFRTVEYNNDLIKRGYNASKASRHLCGQAADFDLIFQGQEVNHYDVQKFVWDSMQNGVMVKGGLGRGATFTHYDTRGSIAQWTY